MSVVIPARDEEAHIGDCLESVLAQTHQDFEVIVIDGASSDATRRIVEDYRSRDGRIRLISNPDQVIPRGLNLAAQAARGRYLVRIDAHATVNPEYVQVLVGHMRTGKWDGAGGRKDGVGHTPAGKAIAAALGSRFGVGNSVYHHGTETQEVDHIPFGAYPLAVIQELGGWDERLRVNQDFEFDYRLRQSGRRLVFDPRARISWLSRQTIASFFRQYFRYGSGKTVVLRLHPASASWRHFGPPALVSALAVAIAAIPFWPMLSVALVVPYAAAVVAASLMTARRLRSWKARLLVPSAFLAMHVGWGLGFMRGVLRPTQAPPASLPVGHRAEAS